ERRQSVWPADLTASIQNKMGKMVSGPYQLLLSFLSACHLIMALKQEQTESLQARLTKRKVEEVPSDVFTG
ncbi:MAG: hypothetical protein PVF72_14035, partial [Desulfobacterales bacterium]